MEGATERTAASADEATSPARPGPPRRDGWPDGHHIRRTLGYVPTVARRYRGHGLDFDELVAAGNLGLVQAALRFDAARNVKFVTYADWWIRKAIREALETQTGPVRLPRYQYERLRLIQRIRRRWTARLGREPELSELADAAGVPAGEVRRVLASVPSGASLEQPVAGDADRPLRDVLADPDSADPPGLAERRDLAMRLARQVARLDERQREVLVLRFGLDGRPPLSLREAGRQLQVSRERVRQIEMQALTRLKQRL